MYEDDSEPEAPSASYVAGYDACAEHHLTLEEGLARAADDVDPGEFERGWGVAADLMLRGAAAMAARDAARAEADTDTDTDTDTGEAEDTAAEIAEAERLIGAAKAVHDHAKLAEAHSTPEELAICRGALLTVMQERGLSNPMDALAVALRAIDGDSMVMDRARLCHAAVTIASEQADEPSLLPELADDRHRENLVGIARKVFDQAQLDAACVAHREWMREHSGHKGDAVKAADLRLREMNLRPGNTTDARALVIYAAVTIQDEGRLNRGDVPTMDSPAGDVGTRGKGRRKGQKGAKSKTGPKKPMRSTGFVKRIGSTVVGFKASFGPDDTRLLEMLQKGGFKRRAEDIKKEPAWGFCPINDAAGSTVDLASLPKIGSDPDYVVFGLRRDAKTGCPTFRFRAEADRQATQEALAEGKANATGGRIREITDNLVDRWYREATPQTQLIPCTWQRSTWTLWVHSDNADALSRAAELAGATLGNLERVPGHLAGLPDDLRRTDLRGSDGTWDGDADTAADLLLFLIRKATAGLAHLEIPAGTLPSNSGAAGRLTWWLEDAIDLDAKTADEKKLRVKLGGAPAEGGSLSVALADGGVIRSARMTLDFNEKRWSLTIGQGGSVRAWKLPTLTKPDGTPEGLDAAIDERLRLWADGDALLATLVAQYRVARIDKGTWRQQVQAFQRGIVVDLDATRERFVKGIQMPLFAPETLDGLEAGNAEAPKGSRGAKARARAAAENGAGA